MPRRRFRRCQQRSADNGWASEPSGLTSLAVARGRQHLPNPQSRKISWFALACAGSRGVNSPRLHFQPFRGESTRSEKPAAACTPAADPAGTQGCEAATPEPVTCVILSRRRTAVPAAAIAGSRDRTGPILILDPPSRASRDRPRSFRCGGARMGTGSRMTGRGPRFPARAGASGDGFADPEDHERGSTTPDRRRAVLRVVAS